MKTLNTKVGLAALILILVLVTPVSALAETIVFAPQTERELMAFLYGRITQLQQLKESLESANSEGNACFVGAGVTIETVKASEINETSATLRGEVKLGRDVTAKAWFEYGEDEDFLDYKTYQISVRSAYDRVVTKKVYRLEESERYYFRIVVEDNNGMVQYGKIRQFRTD